MPQFKFSIPEKENRVRVSVIDSQQVFSFIVYATSARVFLDSVITHFGVPESVIKFRSKGTKTKKDKFIAGAKAVSVR